MDWQHLIMNGENLAEYAAMLAAEGLLGHQHANSGWGTFDDDNMVGATAFMETPGAGASSCAAPATARTASGSASTSTRTPRTRSRRCGAACCSGGSSTEVAGADRRRGAARGAGRGRTRCARTSSSTRRSGRDDAGASACGRERGRRRGVRGRSRVFVADDHGELVAAATMDGAAPDTRLNAQRKAYTAARSDARVDGASSREKRAATRPSSRARPSFSVLQGRRRRFRR